MTREELETIVTRFMDSFSTMTLACCTDQKPWVAAVYYARHGFDLVFFSSPRSMHASMLAKNPLAAAEIHGEYERWQEIKGLQMQGRVERIVSPVALASYTATYLRRYPFVRELFSSNATEVSDIASQMSRVGMYLFRPENIRYLDNKGGFGNRWRLDIVDGHGVGMPVRDEKGL